MPPTYHDSEYFNPVKILHEIKCANIKRHSIVNSNDFKAYDENNEEKHQYQSVALMSTAISLSVTYLAAERSRRVRSHGTSRLITLSWVTSMYVVLVSGNCAILSLTLLFFPV
jgi:hypothetical protein